MTVHLKKSERYRRVDALTRKGRCLSGARRLPLRRRDPVSELDRKRNALAVSIIRREFERRCERF